MVERITAEKAEKAAEAKARKNDNDHFDLLLPSKRSLEDIDGTSDIGSDVVFMPKKPRSSTDHLM